MDKRACYFKRAGHSTRCEDPSGGNRATAFIANEYVAWKVLSEVALCKRETVLVCEACATVKEQTNATVAITCKGCGLPMLVPEWMRSERTCSTRCAQRELRFRRRHKKRMCGTCGLRFETTRIDAKFCSGACRQMAYRAAIASAAVEGAASR